MGVYKLMTLVKSASKAADDAKWDSIRNRMRKKSDDGDNDAVDLEDIERIDGLIWRHKRPFRVLFEEGIKGGRFVLNVIKQHY